MFLGRLGLLMIIFVRDRTARCRRPVAGRQPFCRFATFPLERQCRKHKLTIKKRLRGQRGAGSPAQGELSIRQGLTEEIPLSRGNVAKRQKGCRPATGRKRFLRQKTTTMRDVRDPSVALRRQLPLRRGAFLFLQTFPLIQFRITHYELRIDQTSTSSMVISEKSSVTSISLTFLSFLKKPLTFSTTSGTMPSTLSRPSLPPVTEMSLTLP